MDLYALLPSDLAVVSAGGLVALSFFTSALTAAVGIGGGVPCGDVELIDPPASVAGALRESSAAAPASFSG